MTPNERSPLARIISGTLWSGVSVVGARLLTFAAVVLAARILGREVFGRFGVIQGAILSFTVVGALGMGVAATKLVAEWRYRDPAIAGRAIGTSLAIGMASGFVLALGVVAAAAPLARLLGDPELASALRLSALAMWLGTLANAQSGALAGLEAFTAIARVNVIAGAAGLVALPLASRAAGLVGAVGALVVAAVVQCVAGEIALRRAAASEGLRYAYRGPFETGRVLAVGVPTVLATVLFLPTSWICTAMLARQPEGFRETAAFTAIDQWSNLILTLPAVLGQVLLPVLTNVFARGQTDDGRILFRRIVVGNAFISWAPLLVLVPLAPWLLELYGKDYGGYRLAFTFAIAGAALASSLTPAAQMLIAAGRLWLGFAMNFGWAAIFITATLAFVVRAATGALGLVEARALAYLVHALWLGGTVAFALRRKTPSPAT